MFEWLNNAFLKMVWLEDLFHVVLRDWIGLEVDSMLYNSLHFFLYDVIKIFLLLMALIYLTSLIQSYFTPEKTKRILSRFRGIGGNVVGALLGTVTPFCSCSSIPIFIGFTKAGLPIGVTFSFLISSPLVDLASILLLASMFSIEVAIAYVVVGLLIAILGGTLIQVLHLEKYVESFVFKQSDMPVIAQEEVKLSRKDRHHYAVSQVKEIIQKVWLYILIGVGIGALIHGVIPTEFILSVLGENNPFSVLLATIVGIPMYADIFGTLPIAQALVLKGVGIGTVLAFMMAVTALSLPSLILLKKVVKTKLLVIFVGIVTVGIIIMGYFFNALGYLFF